MGNNSSNSTATPTPRPKRPGPLKSIYLILHRLHHAQPLEHETPLPLLEHLVSQIQFAAHVSQRTARILGTLLLRACVKHPLGWTIPQEVVCMLMYGILQSRQVPAWRAFFSGVGDLQLWVPVLKEKVNTGSCESWWLRLQPEKRPSKPQAKINWVYLHGGAFVAGDALMYTGCFAYWMVYLAMQGIDCSILSVEYPLAPEHPFPAGVNAAADAIFWLLHDSGESADYFVGGDSAGGNLALAGLTLLRDGGKLSRQPLGLTLISPAVDLSNASVFGSREPVSSHFEQQQQGRDAGVGVGGVWQQSGLVNSSSRSSDGFSSSSSSRSGSSRPDMEALIANPAGAAAAGGHSDGSLLSQPQPQQQPDQSPQSAAAAAGGGVTPSPGAAALPLNSSSFRQRPSFTQLPHHQDVDNTSSCQHHHHQQQPHQHVNVAQRQLQQQHVPLEPQPSIECKLHAAHTAGGKLRPLRLMRGLLGEVFTALRVHSSSSSAREVAKSGWFDYLPADSVSDELHCYLKDASWLSHPLVSPTYLQDFSGLCQHGMLVVAGGAELMRRDIEAFAAKAARAGVSAAATAASDGATAKGRAAGAGAAASGQQGDGSSSGSSNISGSSSGRRGFDVVYHEEPDEPHVFAVLMLPHLMEKGLVVPRFVAAVVRGEEVEGMRVGVGRKV